jgi:branched-chain amino acid transport system substrate-binding protein
MDRRRFSGLTAVAAAIVSLGLFSSGAYAQAKTEFKIGALSPVTGAGAPYGAGMQKAAEVAVAQINAAGGAHGAMFKMSAEDSQTSPQAAVLGAKKLLEVEKVRAIVACWSSGEALAVIPLTNEANIPLFHGAGAPALSDAPVNAKKLGFRMQATNGRFGQAFAKIAEKEKFSKPATMAFNNASGIGNTEGFRSAWEKAGGKVVASVVYEPNRPSYRSELQSILRAKPDVVVTGSYLGDTTIILREWYQSGQPAKWIIPGWAANDDLIKALGNEVTEGIISVESVSNESSPTYTSFLAAMAKAGVPDAKSNVYASMSYDEVILLGLAVQALGPDASGPDLAKKVHEIGNAGGEKVTSFEQGKKLIEAGKRVTYEGASSALNFDASNDVTPDFAASFIEAGKLVRKYIVKI